MIQKSNTDKILEVFFKDPEKKFSLKEISKAIGLAHTSVKRELEELIKEKYLKRENEKRGKRTFPTYFANLAEKFICLKKLFNEREILESRIIELLVKKTFPNSIVLFGSYSRGEDLKNSDIDLFVESDFREMDLGVYERKLKRNINILFKRNINELKKETLNNIINGRILYGAIKIK
jgi:predicted nucleotidyltransferase